MHLYFGGRDPNSDYFYQGEITQWLGDKRLSCVTTAFSRVTERHYVQDHIRRDAEAIRAMVVRGAQIMVCGGRNMAEGVRSALEDVLAPLGLSPATLKLQGRYAEDVY
jgi:sulfite reductase (NADPH) flavoprotein alpha-component